MPNNKFPEDSDNFLNFGDDPLRKEEYELQKIMLNILAKLNRTDKSPVSNEEILQYMRVINFNFAALQRIMSGLYARQSSIEDAVIDANRKQTEILEKISDFFESQTLLQEALDDPPQSENEI